LAAFGGALADADGPREAPFVMAHPPFDLRRERRAALFGSLASAPVFFVRSLGSGRDRAREAARVVGRALVTSIRLDAARVILHRTMTDAPRDRDERWEEVTARALGAPIPGELSALVPRVGSQAAVRLCGGLLAALDRRSLVERFDEDWFRSPHALAKVREEDSVLPERRKVSEQSLRDGLREVVRTLGELD
jgi:hypothetical protein